MSETRPNESANDTSTSTSGGIETNNEENIVIHNDDTDGGHCNNEGDLNDIEKKNTAGGKSSANANDQNRCDHSSNKDDGDNNTNEERHNSMKEPSNGRGISTSSRSAAASSKSGDENKKKSKSPYPRMSSVPTVKKLNSYGLEVIRVPAWERSKYGLRRRGYIWEHYNDVVGDFPKPRAECIYCGHEIQGASNQMRRHSEFLCDYIPDYIKQELIVLNRENAVARQEFKRRREILRQGKQAALIPKPTRRFESTSLVPKSSAVEPPVDAKTTERARDNLKKSVGERNFAPAGMLLQQPSTSVYQEMLRMKNAKVKVPGNKRRRKVKDSQQQQLRTQRQPLQQPQPPSNTLPFLDKNTPDWAVSLITSTNSLSTQLTSLSSQLATHTANVEAQLANANARISNLELQLLRYQNSSTSNDAAHASRTAGGGNANLNQTVIKRRVEDEYDLSSGDDDDYYDDDESDDQSNEDDAYYRQGNMII